MRALTTIAYGFAAALAFVVVAGHVIGPPDPDEARHGGLTAATVLGTDGSQADAEREAAASPSS
ncbi:hypothetical protein [Methylobacterium sp. J-076]|uniref:hypothetical protein n=1 Tax=Methylobacterium sp. J-076 TaxID=2836655 RepID=UPI001FBA3B9A|nr:hypothetical protein [Methylobacterium sp. J-076]MCJ2014655.1 hypothetical protein [Methylobacterium sp. J-076]